MAIGDFGTELPLGSEVVVVNLQNGREAMLTINDRGPHADDRIIDVSGAAAKSLGMIDDGHGTVRIEVISTP